MTADDAMMTAFDCCSESHVYCCQSVGQDRKRLSKRSLTRWIVKDKKQKWCRLYQRSCRDGNTDHRTLRSWHASSILTIINRLMMNHFYCQILICRHNRRRQWVEFTSVFTFHDWRTLNTLCKMCFPHFPACVFASCLTSRTSVYSSGPHTVYNRERLTHLKAVNYTHTSHTQTLKHMQREESPLPCGED